MHVQIHDVHFCAVTTGNVVAVFVSPVPFHVYTTWHAMDEFMDIYLVPVSAHEILIAAIIPRNVISIARRFPAFRERSKHSDNVPSIPRTFPGSRGYRFWVRVRVRFFGMKQ